MTTLALPDRRLALPRRRRGHVGAGSPDTLAFWHRFLATTLPTLVSNSTAAAPADCDPTGTTHGIASYSLTVWGNTFTLSQVNNALSVLLPNSGGREYERMTVFATTGSSSTTPFGLALVPTGSGPGAPTVFDFSVSLGSHIPSELPFELFLGVDSNSAHCAGPAIDGSSTATYVSLLPSTGSSGMLDAQLNLLGGTAFSVGSPDAYGGKLEYKLVFRPTSTTNLYIVELWGRGVALGNSDSPDWEMLASASQAYANETVLYPVMLLYTSAAAAQQVQLNLIRFGTAGTEGAGQEPLDPAVISRNKPVYSVLADANAVLPPADWASNSIKGGSLVTGIGVASDGLPQVMFSRGISETIKVDMMLAKASNAAGTAWGTPTEIFGQGDFAYNMIGLKSNYSGASVSIVTNSDGSRTLTVNDSNGPSTATLSVGATTPTYEVTLLSAILSNSSGVGSWINGGFTSGHPDSSWTISIAEDPATNAYELGVPAGWLADTTGGAVSVNNSTFTYLSMCPNVWNAALAIAGSNAVVLGVVDRVNSSTGGSQLVFKVSSNANQTTPTWTTTGAAGGGAVDLSFIGGHFAVSYSGVPFSGIYLPASAALGSSYPNGLWLFALYAGAGASLDLVACNPSTSSCLPSISSGAAVSSEWSYVSLAFSTTEPYLAVLSDGTPIIVGHQGNFVTLAYGSNASPLTAADWSQNTFNGLSGQPLILANAAPSACAVNEGYVYIVTTIEQANGRAGFSLWKSTQAQSGSTIATAQFQLAPESPLVGQSSEFGRIEYPFLWTNAGSVLLAYTVWRRNVVCLVDPQGLTRDLANCTIDASGFLWSGPALLDSDGYASKPHMPIHLNATNNRPFIAYNYASGVFQNATTGMLDSSGYTQLSTLTNTIADATSSPVLVGATNFTLPALGGGLTAQQVRNAMALALSSGTTPAAGSIDAQIAATQQAGSAVTLPSLPSVWTMAIDAAVAGALPTDYLTSAEQSKLANLDAAVSSRQPAGNVTVGAYASGQVPPNAAAIAAAVWQDATSADFTVADSAGALLSATQGISSGGLSSGQAAQLASLVSMVAAFVPAQVSLVSPVALGGQLHVTVGTSYGTNTNNAITIGRSWWPDISEAGIALRWTERLGDQLAASPTFVAPGAALTASAVSFELTSEQTSQLTPGCQYSVVAEAVLSSGEVIVLAKWEGYAEGGG
jgi:hypothetical protein